MEDVPDRIFRKEIMEEEKKEGQEISRRGRSRRQQDDRKEKKTWAAAAGILCTAAIAVLGLTGFYFLEREKYETAFFPHTSINGVDASGKTAEEVKEEIEAGLLGYELKLLARNQGEAIIKGSEIGLHSEFDGSLEEILSRQDPGNWIQYLRTGPEHQIETMIVYDEEKLKECVAALPFMDKEAMEEPENAKISEYDSDTKSYSILSEQPGTELMAEAVEEAVKRAVMNLEPSVDLDAEECYTKPAITGEDESLLAAVAELNGYVGAVVTHTFGEEKEVLDGDRIHTWLSVEGANVTLDESQAAVYVKELAQKHDTAYKPKTLKTSYGETVTITKGHYGWRINQSAEAAAVLEIVKNGEQATREPEYSQKAASHGENDYGNTYVELNLTAQHLYFYKDGELLVESDFVSGNESRGWSTPGGAYPLTYKQRNATLRGEGYATPVSYWMPFNGGIGLHDASWRGSFGGSIYKTNGSHGCVNLPSKVAKTIYENISQGDPVLCYYLSGTESKKTSSTTKPQKETTAAAETTAAVQETTAPTEAAPTTAPTETSPAGPSVEVPTQASTEESPAGPGYDIETAPAETPAAPVESGPTGPTAPSEPSAPSVTAGGDAEHFGPGFADSAPEQTEAPIGPGY